MRVIDSRVTAANEVLVLALDRLPDPNAAADVLALALGRLCERHNVALDQRLDMTRAAHSLSKAGRRCATR